MNGIYSCQTMRIRQMSTSPIQRPRNRNPHRSLGNSCDPGRDVLRTLPGTGVQTRLATSCNFAPVLFHLHLPRFVQLSFSLVVLVPSVDVSSISLVATLPFPVYSTMEKSKRMAEIPP